MPHRNYLTAGLMLAALLSGRWAKAETPAQRPLEGLLSQVAREIVLKELPDRFVDDSDWNHEKTFISRFRVAGKPLKPKVEKVKTSKEHGNWTRFQGHVPEADKNLYLAINNLRTEGAETRFSVVTRVPLQGEAEMQQWARGVRLMGVTVEAQAEVEIRMEVRLVTRLVPGPIVASPDLLVEVLSAEIDLRHFQIDRIGQADGPVASWIGDQLKGQLRRKVAKRNEKLVEKSNQAIQRQMEKGNLRLDPYQLVQHLWRPGR